MQGRAEQRYWDLSEDDGEYDMDRRPGKSANGEGGGLQARRFQLNANARHRLAAARIKKGEIEKGKVSLVLLVVGDADFSCLAPCKCGLDERYP